MMVTRTYYFPRKQVGRAVLNYLVSNVGCSVGEIRKVADSLAVPITAPSREDPKIKHILQMYDLIN